MVASFAGVLNRIQGLLVGAKQAQGSKVVAVVVHIRFALVEEVEAQLAVLHCNERHPRHDSWHDGHVEQTSVVHSKLQVVVGQALQLFVRGRCCIAATRGQG